MLSNRAAFAALALACVTAAGAGAFFATRQNAGSQPVVAAEADLRNGDLAAVAAKDSKPVQETEAVIGDAPRPEPVAPASAAASRREQPRTTNARPAPAPVRTAPATTARSAQLPSLERSWPSQQPSAPATTSASSSTTTESSSATATAERAAEPPRSVEPSRPVEPPAPAFEELVVSADSVIGVQLETAVSSETARVEDPIEARVARDVRAGGAIAIPAGSRALGSVMVVERGGKFKERARLGIRFHTLVLADGTRVPVTTETIYRYGEGQGQQSAAKIGGGAVLGAILGGIAGGAKGAAIGAATGGGAGTAVVAAGDRSIATFSPGTEVTARILSPVTVTVEK
jgi:type IV secretory pathway VirB10-like protein